MKHQVPHRLEATPARELIESLVETYKQHYAEVPVSSSWPAPDRLVFDAEVKGRQVAGVILVSAQSYDFEIDLPWALRPFKGKITTLLDREVARWMDARASD